MTKGNVTVSIFVKPDGGHHWMLWQDMDCVGESESPLETAEAALRAAKQWAKKYGYGQIVGERLLPTRPGRKRIAGQSS